MAVTSDAASAMRGTVARLQFRNRSLSIHNRLRHHALPNGPPQTELAMYLVVLTYTQPLATLHAAPSLASLMEQA